jgi:hypothetical protein
MQRFGHNLSRPAFTPDLFARGLLMIPYQTLLMPASKCLNPRQIPGPLPC